MIRAQGEPFNSTSIYAQYRVFKLAREHNVTVTLDGQGADEMLAGYSGYPGQRIRSLVEKGSLAEAWHFLDEWARWPGRSRLQGAKRAVAEMTQGPSVRCAAPFERKQDIFRRGYARIPLEERGIIRRYPRLRSDCE
jgi:asparagine synthase (glutamine-hydrolysing)